MPIEDRDWYREQASTSKNVCPRCRGDRIYYNSRFHSWRCGSCEQSFTRPMVINEISDSEWLKGFLGV